MWHDTWVLLLTVTIDAAILAVWHLLTSTLYDRDSEVPAGIGSGGPSAPVREPMLHRVTAWACGLLLAGLILESTGLAVVIVLRYGFSR